MSEIGLVGLCVLLIVVSPMLTHHNVDSAVATLLGELHPWPGGDLGAPN